MFTLHNITYLHPDKEMLFNSLNFTLNKGEKVALIGQNGVGKSTLLKLISGEISPSEGEISSDEKIYFVSQVYGQLDEVSVAEALKIDSKLKAFHAILEGEASEENFEILNDDWDLENRVVEAFSKWNIEDISVSDLMKTLSGGQKTKVLLAGIDIHEADFVILDEPSNHLDFEARQLLYNFVSETSKTLLMVSHDRTLLNLLDKVVELSSKGIQVFGGNYEFYKAQKEASDLALENEIKSKEKSLKKAKDVERETLERQQKLDSRGKKKQEKVGVARIMMNTLRNKAENSSSKMKDIHAEKIGGISEDLSKLRREVSQLQQMKFNFDDSALHQGKILFNVKELNFKYNQDFLWKEDLNFQILSGERWSLKGNNASGKSTLVKLLLGILKPSTGKIEKTDFKSIYLDQNYSILNENFNVLEQAEHFNRSPIPDHELKTILTRFLFRKEVWDKKMSSLSGGERMRLLLACLSIMGKAQDLIVLDEPTNNLDLENVEILTSALQDYKGSLIVISHDQEFLKDLNVQKEIFL